MQVSSIKNNMFEHKIFVGGRNVLFPTDDRSSLRGILLESEWSQFLGRVLSVLTGGLLGIKIITSSTENTTANNTASKGKAIHILTTRSEFSDFANTAHYLQKVKNVWFATLKAKQ